LVGTFDAQPTICVQQLFARHYCSNDPPTDEGHAGKIVLLFRGGNRLQTGVISGGERRVDQYILVLKKGRIGT
jgi:hypothetical protein